LSNYKNRVNYHLIFLAALAGAEEMATPSDHKDKLSYSIGVNPGKSLKEIPFTLNLDLVSRSIKDAFSGAKPLMTEKEMTMKVQKQMKVLGEKNKKEGEPSLAENKKKEGVVF